MTEKGKNTPTVRFKGFCDDWEQRKLGEIAEIIGGGTPSTNNPSYWDGDIDWYAPAEIGERIFANGSIRKITKEGLNHCSAKILPAYKTVLFTSRAGIGKMAILQHPATTNQGFQSLVCHNDIAPYFVFSMGKNIKAGAERVAAGSTFAEISGKTLSNLEFMFPNTAEQQAIGACFKNIDMLITLHQRQLGEQKALKKYFLQNMFPAKGEKVPRIRFQGFTDDWEERKLGDLMDVGSVKRVHQTDWRDSGIRFLRARDIVSESKHEEPADYLYIDEKMYSEYSALSGKVQKGDLLVTGVGTIGVPMLIKSDDPVYFKDGNIIWFKNKNAIDGNFFYYSFTSKQIQNYIKDSAGIGTVGTYTIDSGKKTPITLPSSKEEQQKIGAYFQRLDNLITLHQRQLTQLQAVKKFMLQNLFV